MPPPGRLEPLTVTTEEALESLLQSCRESPLIAVDTEAASFHRYLDRMYLIQISTREITAVIDPVAIQDLSEFGEILADPTREIVFHDGDYDLRLMDRQYGYHACNLFDTRIGAQFLNEPGIGLAALLAKYLDITADKRFQRADWSARPLSPEMLSYAATDTHYLLELRDILRDQLLQQGRLSWCEEEFEHLEKVRWTGSDDRDSGFFRIKGAKDLTSKQLAVLREIWRWRERVASRLDRAAFRILGNEAMLDLARNPVERPEDLVGRKGIGSQSAGRKGRELVAAIRRGLRVPEKDYPHFERTLRRPVDREVQARLAQLKKARNAVAARLELPPGVVCPNGTLEEVARAVPGSLEELAQLPSVRRWQAATFGQELLDALPKLKSP